MQSVSPSLKIALLFLVFALVACAKSDFASVPLAEGETAVISVDGLDYEITLLDVSAEGGIFNINGETTPRLKNGETWTASSGFKFKVTGLTATGAAIDIEVPKETS